MQRNLPLARLSNARGKAPTAHQKVITPSAPSLAQSWPAFQLTLMVTATLTSSWYVALILIQWEHPPSFSWGIVIAKSLNTSRSHPVAQYLSASRLTLDLVGTGLCQWDSRVSYKSGTGHYKCKVRPNSISSSTYAHKSSRLARAAWCAGNTSNPTSVWPSHLHVHNTSNAGCRHGLGFLCKI